MLGKSKEYVKKCKMIRGNKMAKFRHISEILSEILPEILREPKDKKTDKIEEPSETEEVPTDG